MRFIRAVNALLRPFDARLVRASTYHPVQVQLPGHGFLRENPAAEATTRDSSKEPDSQRAPESGGAVSTSGPGPQGAVPADGTPRSNPGHCPCCGQDVFFVESGPWLRDQYVCANCNSIPRHRHTNHILDKYFPGWESRKIHECSPATNFISRRAHDYSCSYYFEHMKPGSTDSQGRRCENLEQLTFADEEFDLFITQDVFEHVFRPDLAQREIMRVLKPGGAHVFTAPKHKHVQKSYCRAMMNGSGVVHVHEPVYHGNPVDENGSLVTWDYGDDFECLLWEWCGFPTVTYVTRDRSLGLDGEYPEVFVTRKIRAE